MDVQVSLKEGIKAAQAGDHNTARDILYKVLDTEPRNEMAWVWLSYVSDSLDDRQICLENVLLINPANQYAKLGLEQVHQVRRQLHQAQNRTSQKSFLLQPMLPLNLVTAFWFGLGLLLLLLGLFDLGVWSVDLITSRTFPDYITPFQLFDLSSVTAFLILSIIALNIAWAFFKRHRIGYLASIICAFGLILLGPTAAILSQTPSYLISAFMIIMPTIILFLTLISQTGFEHDK